MSYKFISSPYNIDRKLYKYFSNTAYAIDSIKNRRIHLDKPRDFNDPFEAMICFHHYISSDLQENKRTAFVKIQDYLLSVPQYKQTNHHFEMIKYLASIKEQYINLIDDQSFSTLNIVGDIYSKLDSPSFSLQDFRSEIDYGYEATAGIKYLDCKMSCFSELWDSILMWSYYANSHKGVCVEYDLSKLDDQSTLNQQIYSQISKVHYSPIRTNSPTGNDSTLFNFLLTKANVWSHEHEWRIICETTEDEEYLPFDCISNVYIGTNFDTSANKYQDLIKAVNSYPNLSISRCSLHAHNFQLTAAEVHNSSFAFELNKQKKASKEKKNAVAESIA